MWMRDGDFTEDDDPRATPDAGDLDDMSPEPHDTVDPEDVSGAEDILEDVPPTHAVRRRRLAPRSKAMRRLTATLVLLGALVGFGVAYSAIAPAGNTAAAQPVDPAQIAAGRQLYNNSCITCHGANLQGVQDRGVSLIGVGSAAAYFQLATGRMPAAANGAEMSRKRPVFTDEQIQQLMAYIESVGGGPEVPSGSLRDDANLARGGELYRLNCASCHNFTGRGGALSQGKYAPPLNEASDAEIYAAMLSGPENMPKFSDGQLPPEFKKAIISYIQATNNTISPGGYDLGGFGPAPEGLIAFLVGMGLIVAVTLWSGSRR
jgi:ubiquinol-cytochrome c reductase cytochrome c subunit